MTATKNSVIAANLGRIKERIKRAADRARRRAEDVTIVAVSKTFPFEVIRAAYDAGLRHFGENRVQEWESKQPQVVDLAATWHLIGHLQGNKARRASGLFDRVDSVDSLAIALKLEAAFAADHTGVVDHGKRLQVLIEVRLSDEASKSGAAESDLPALVEGVARLAHLQLLGLMTIPPFLDDPERVRPYFSKLRELRDDLAQRLGQPLPVLSMGMSHDFDVALEEGATEIRLGTALFGGRAAKA
ncbi:MAG: YggS family pyridoxal phosphate-dependent enzyme [Candidatus Acidiferrales bacterium]